MSSFDLILDYDEFRVYYDYASHEYLFIDEIKISPDSTKDMVVAEEIRIIKVEPVATLHYSIIDDCKAEEPQLCSLFDNFCCGEQVTDDEIIYWWFKEK